MSGHIGPEKWGIAKFFFRVTMDGTQLSFTEVNGLTSETAVIEHRLGDSEDFFTRKQLGISKFSDLTFNKPVFSDDLNVIEIYNAIYDKEYMSETTGRFDVLIELLDELGDTVISWNAHNAIPLKMEVGGLKSDDSALAVETLVLAVESVTVA